MSKKINLAEISIFARNEDGAPLTNNDIEELVKEIAKVFSKKKIDCQITGAVGEIDLEEKKVDDCQCPNCIARRADKPKEEQSNLH